MRHIDSFLESFVDYLSGSVTGEEWERQVELYRDALQRRDLTFAVKSNRLWEQISNGKEKTEEAVTVIQLSCIRLDSRFICILLIIKTK